MQSRRWKLTILILLGGLGIAGIGAYRYFFHDPLPPVSAEAGEQFFLHRDLGAP